MKNVRLMISTALSGVGMMLAPGAVHAQDEGAQGGLQEITVTATRRSTDVQSTPLAITAVGGDEMRRAGISNPSDLTGIAPNLTVDQGFSAGQTHVSIRGLASTDFGLGSQSPIALYMDDVYQSFQYGLGTQIFDLDRIEVLRGPQGTLFGKNTTGGALAYYSKAPEQGVTGGYFQVGAEGGDFGLYNVEGAFNMPLTSTLAMRVSARAEHRDDYIDNLYDDTELGHYSNMNGRVQLAWEPTADTKVNLKVFGVRSNGDGPVYIGRWRGSECDASHAYDIYNSCVDGVAAPDSEDSRHTNSESPTLEKYHTYGATLKIDQSLGEWGLTSITGWQKSANTLRTNDDGAAGDLFHSYQASRTEQFSQEVRLATPDANRVKAIVGAIYGWDKIVADQGSGSTELDPALGYDYYAGSYSTQTTKTLAAFGSLTFDVTDSFHLIGGARYSYEKKDNHTLAASLLGFNAETFETRDFTDAELSFPVAIANLGVDPAYGDVYEVIRVKDSWKKFTWDATANYNPSQNLLLYAKVATGFRSGGFPTFVTQPGTFTRLDPESVTSYEGGFKLKLLNNTLRFNASAYYMKYSDMQVQTPNTSGPGLIISNAASAEIKGIEAELEFVPTAALRLHATLGFNDAKYKDYSISTSIDNAQGGTTVIVNDYSGNRLPYAPRWSGGFGASYEIPVGDAHSVQLGSDWTLRSSIYFDPYENKNGAYDNTYLMGSVQASYGTVGDGWRVTAYVNNVLDQSVKAFQFDLSYVSPAIYGAYRQFGMRASFDF